MIIIDPELVAGARRGSRAALEALVGAIQGTIFNLSMRMLANGADAEDATQEILIKIVTNLAALRDDAAAGGWAFRIACRHLVHERRRGRIEAQRLTFRRFAADLEDGLEELADDSAADPDMMIAVEEVKIGCTLALTTCLSRKFRAAYIPGEIFEMTDREAAQALDISPAAYRQRLHRARALISRFMQLRCGLVTSSAPCRCDRRVRAALRLGRVVMGQKTAGVPSGRGSDIASIRRTVAQLEGARAAAAVMRSNPTFTSDVGQLVLRVIGAEGSGAAPGQ